MTTRLYKINGVYNTWQYWHDSCGYSESPSQPMSFKRSDGDHWGENAGDGYALNSDGELSQWSMWSDGIVGWFDANDLAEQGAYPASSADLFVERTGEKAKAVSLDDGTNTYYLIDGYLDLGWRLWEVLEAEGWQISSGGELAYIIVDEDTGEIVFSQNDPGMEFAEVGTLLMPDSEMILVQEASLPLATFYLNPEGRDATENHTLSLVDNPVFDADGNNILYADYPDLQGNKPFCFMRVDNTFFMGGEGDSLINFSEGKAGIGALASLGKSAWSVSFEVPPTELTAYFTSAGASATSNKEMTWGNYQLYDASGAVILSDDNHTYTFVKAYDYAGNEVAIPSAVYAPVFNNSGTLCLGMSPGSFTAYRLTYIVSDNT